MQQYGIAFIFLGVILALLTGVVDTIWLSAAGLVAVVLGLYLVYTEYSKESSTV